MESEPSVRLGVRRITRLGYLPDIIGLVDANLAMLDSELARRHAKIEALTRKRIAYTFRGYAPVKRVLICAASFIAESRACFENLADFYRNFSVTYFDDRIGSDAAAYTAVAAMTASPQWATDLKKVRDDLLHERALWIAFEVLDSSPRYEPLLLLNWRPGHFRPNDCIKFRTLREIRDGLLEAAEAMKRRLIHRIGGLP
jgi:hypothetical protein